VTVFKSKKRPMVTEDALLELMHKLEHQTEILMAIAHSQEIAGHPELAKSYRNQAHQLRERAQSFGKILTRF